MYFRSIYLIANDTFMMYILRVYYDLDKDVCMNSIVYLLSHQAIITTHSEHIPRYKLQITLRANHKVT